MRAAAETLGIEIEIAGAPEGAEEEDAEGAEERRCSIDTDGDGEADTVVDRDRRRRRRRDRQSSRSPAAVDTDGDGEADTIVTAVDLDG